MFRERTAHPHGRAITLAITLILLDRHIRDDEHLPGVDQVRVANAVDLRQHAPANPVTARNLPQRVAVLDHVARAGGGFAHTQVRTRVDGDAAAQPIQALKFRNGCPAAPRPARKYSDHEKGA